MIPEGFTMPEPEPEAPGATVGTYGAKARTRAQIGKGSSAKGANGEREALGLLRERMVQIETELGALGLSFVPRSDFATRKRLEKGTSNRDLGNIPLISVEVKRNEKLNVPKAWEQAVRQAEPDKLLPVLIYRYNREPWRIRTWVALTAVNGAVLNYAVGEISLPDFLDYFGAMYRRFLTEGLGNA